MMVTGELFSGLGIIWLLVISLCSVARRRTVLLASNAAIDAASVGENGNSSGSRTRKMSRPPVRVATLGHAPLAFASAPAQKDFVKF